MFRNQFSICGSSKIQSHDSSFLEIEVYNQRREDMTSRRSDNLYALVTCQGQESLMQVTRIALWTKSRRAHCVFY